MLIIPIINLILLILAVLNIYKGKNTNISVGLLIIVMIINILMEVLKW